MKVFEERKERRRNWRRNPVEAAGRVGGIAVRRIEFLVELIPEGEYTGVLAGGLRLLCNVRQCPPSFSESCAYSQSLDGKAQEGGPTDHFGHAGQLGRHCLAQQGPHHALQRRPGSEREVGESLYGHSRLCDFCRLPFESIKCWYVSLWFQAMNAVVLRLTPPCS